jgi:hypothetical protein
MQATAYGLALGSHTAVLLYINRDTGERFTVGWPVKDYADRLLDWLGQANYPPEQVPRDERGPGLSMICDECPFAEECWAPIRPDQDPQGVVANEIGVEEALMRYADARQQGKHADEDKEFWRRVLAGSPKGAYGEWKLSWSHITVEVLDGDEAERMLVEAGLPVPTKAREQTRINVRRTTSKDKVGSAQAPQSEPTPMPQKGRQP